MNIFKAEKIKLKNSKVLLSSIWIPVVCGLFSLFFGGTYNVIAQTIYWWLGSFLLFLLQLFVYINLTLEKKANNNFNIESIHIKKSKIYISKILLTTYYGAISNVVLLLVIFFFRWSMPRNPFFDSTVKMIVGICMILLTSIWIIPLFILLARKVSGIVVILLNFIVSLLVIPFVASSRFYFFIPYTYPYKVGKNFFYIKESGDIMRQPLMSVDKLELSIVIVLSFVLYIVLSIAVCRQDME